MTQKQPRFTNPTIYHGTATWPGAAAAICYSMLKKRPALAADWPRRQ